jgi:hypothetical protein
MTAAGASARRAGAAGLGAQGWDERSIQLTTLKRIYSH